MLRIGTLVGDMINLLIPCMSGADVNRVDLSEINSKHETLNIKQPA